MENPNLIYPGIQLAIPSSKPSIEANAYTYQAPEAAAQSIEELNPLLTYLSPFAYMITQNGTLSPMRDELMVETALENNVAPILSITNFTTTEAGSNLAHTFSPLRNIEKTC